MFAIGRTLATVKLGVHKTYDTYHALLGADVSEWAEDIRKKTPFSQTPTDLNLVMVSVEQLGFDEAIQFNFICRCIMKLGFDLCPAEVGPALRLIYQDQPRNESLIIAMEALTASDEHPRVFGVVHDGDGLWLDSYYGRPSRLFRLGEQFVVARRKQT